MQRQFATAKWHFAAAVELLPAVMQRMSAALSDYEAAAVTGAGMLSCTLPCGSIGQHYSANVGFGLSHPTSGCQIPMPRIVTTCRMYHICILTF